MNKVNLLLGRGSPRSNIPKVEVQNEFLPCDKIIPRYILEYKAYKIMRDYFLSHKEYTHLVLATDDIIVLPQHITALQKDLEEFDYPVLSGMMNVDQDDRLFLNISYRIAAKNRSLRLYDWITTNSLPDKDIFQVEFSGFPLMAIRRDVVELFEFDADRVFDGMPPQNGASLDLVFCHNCKDNEIPVMVDQRISMIHRRKSGQSMVNINPAKIVLWKFDGAQKFL